MEHGTLRALKAAEAPHLLPPARSLAILRAVSDSLFPLHAAGRAYGVFGPDSVLVDGDGARLAEEPTYDETYAAPELRAGGDPTPASDAFAYAALAHRMLAGDEAAFDGNGVPLPITDRHPGFPAFAAEALARALQPDPSKRPLPKVLDTLLQVVPVNRWPAASQRVAAAASAELDEVEAEVEQVEQVEQPADEVRSEDLREARHDEFRRALTPDHAVPDIGWSASDHAEPDDTRTLIDWTPDVGADPTRPTHEVPEIRWTPRALNGEPDPLTDELPLVDATFEDPGADPVGEAIEEAVAAPVEEQEDEEPEAEEPEVAAAEPAAAEDPEEPVEPLEPFEEEEFLDEQVLAGRVRSTRRRRRHRWTGDQIQKIALLAILVLLLTAGLIFALVHRNGPAYDPTLHGASRSLSQPVSVLE